MATVVAIKSDRAGVLYSAILKQWKKFPRAVQAAKSDSSLQEQRFDGRTQNEK